MISDDDLSPQLAQAFADRHLSLAPSGRFLAEQEAADTATRDAEHATQASDWLRSQGLGDALPSPNDYDYTAMIRDAVYPTKDGAGRVPLPPKYWKPGRMMTNVPPKPTTTASQRRMPTFSPRTTGDSMVMISGCTKKIAKVSAMGRNLRPQKKKKF